MGRSKKNNNQLWVINKNKIEKILAYKDRINKNSVAQAQNELHKLNDVFKKHKDIINCIELSNQTGISFFDLVKYGVVEKKASTPFSYIFSEKQINILTDILNCYISAMPFQITAKQVETIFNTQEYIGFIRVKNNRVLAFLFNELAIRGLICSNWQEVIEKDGLFKSKTGNKLTAKSLSVALARYKDDDLQRDFIKEPMIEPYCTIKEMLYNL